MTVTWMDEKWIGQGVVQCSAVARSDSAPALAPAWLLWKTTESGMEAAVSEAVDEAPGWSGGCAGVAQAGGGGWGEMRTGRCSSGC